VAAGWNSLFAAWLAERKRYPEAARRRGEQGNVTLRFKVAGDGTVLDVALVEGSGSAALDEAATALLRDARVPPPRTEISRTVRLRYRLDD
jgi:protein TonB